MGEISKAEPERLDGSFGVGGDWRTVACPDDEDIGGERIGFEGDTNCNKEKHAGKLALLRERFILAVMSRSSCSRLTLTSESESKGSLEEKSASEEASSSEGTWDWMGALLGLPRTCREWERGLT